MAINLNASEVIEVFGEHDPTLHEAEAASRWGETDAYKQSNARTSKYSKSEWQASQVDGDLIVANFIDAMSRGLVPDSTEAKTAAEAHRLNITKWFYDCSHEMHTNLAQMYLADPRFTQYYEDKQAGLAQYVHDSILANALDHINK
jgi:hypothetical protein